MKKNKIIYWVSTALVAAMMLFSAYAYLTSPDMKAAFIHFGFPGYFRIELAIAKILGVIVLLIPAIPNTGKQFAYFGFAIVFVSAFIAHLSVGDAFVHAFMPLLFLLVLGVSYFYRNKLNSLKII